MSKRPPVDKDFYEIGIAQNMNHDEIIEDWYIYCDDLEKFLKETEQTQINPPMPPRKSFKDVIRDILAKFHIASFKSGKEPKPIDAWRKK
jgi:hypothetical protein